MTLHRSLQAFFLPGILLLAVAGAGPAHAGDDWLPITPEELQMKSYQGAPGAHAILLYREMHTDDVGSFDRSYFRIKILTEEGKKYADIEILYLKDLFQIRDIKARTVHPDGRVINFDGRIFEKTVVKARGVKFLAKTFTLAEVQVGSIIEYKYRTSGTSASCTAHTGSSSTSFSPGRLTFLSGRTGSPRCAGSISACPTTRTRRKAKTGSSDWSWKMCVRSRKKTSSRRRTS